MPKDRDDQLPVQKVVPMFKNMNSFLKYFKHFCDWL